MGAFSLPAPTPTASRLHGVIPSLRRLAVAERHLATGRGSTTQKKVLAVFIRTFGCYQMKDPDAVTLRGECTKVEDAL